MYHSAKCASNSFSRFPNLNLFAGLDEAELAPNSAKCFLTVSCRTERQYSSHNLTFVDAMPVKIYHTPDAKDIFYFILDNPACA